MSEPFHHSPSEQHSRILTAITNESQITNKSHITNKSSSSSFFVFPPPFHDFCTFFCLCLPIICSSLQGEIHKRGKPACVLHLRIYWRRHTSVRETDYLSCPKLHWYVHDLFMSLTFRGNLIGFSTSLGHAYAA